MRQENSAPRKARWIGKVFWIIAMLFCVAVALPLQSLAQEPADAPPLRIQILNGKTGRPVTSQHVVLMREDLGAAVKLADEKTDGEGYAPIPNVEAPAAKVGVLVEGHAACSRVVKHSFELVKVRTAGVVSENTCKPRITLFPQAGTLVLFVRDETFFERMRR